MTSWWQRVFGSGLNHPEDIFIKPAEPFGPMPPITQNRLDALAVHLDLIKQQANAQLTQTKAQRMQNIRSQGQLVNQGASGNGGSSVVGSGGSGGAGVSAANYPNGGAGAAGSYGSVGTQGPVGTPGTTGPIGGLGPGVPTGNPGSSGSSPVVFDGAMIIMNVDGKPRFMSYTDHWVLVHNETIRVLGRNGGTVAMLPLSATFGVYKSTSKLIDAWVVRNEECPLCTPSTDQEPSETSSDRTTSPKASNKSSPTSEADLSTSLDPQAVAKRLLLES